MKIGHCFERDNKEPPRGLQLLLGTRGQPHMVDTIVMANLGYWQLKAAPGVWTLALAPGRSTELYTLLGKNEGTNKGPLSRRIIIGDLRGQPVRLEVMKKKGMEDEKILDAEGGENDEEPSRVGSCPCRLFGFSSLIPFFIPFIWLVKGTLFLYWLVTVENN